jgi:MFS transporter, SP family, arabinose:H+ symporter
MSETEPPKSMASSFVLIRICLVVAMGGFLFGYDWVVIGGAKPFYEPYFEIQNSPLLQGWTMSSALVGCLVGAMGSGLWADRFGRKKLLIVAGFLFTLSAIGTAVATDVSSFNIYRILGGIGIGIVSGLSPMYIAEISPPASRGRLVSINQLNIVVGILAAQLVNWMIAREVPENVAGEVLRQTWNGTHGWRWMFAAEGLPAIAFFFLMFFVPESPRWLAKRGMRGQAKHVLERIGGDAFANSELAIIEASIAESARAIVATRDLLERRTRGVLGLGVSLVVFQQWCGINVIFNYAQEVFAAAGYGVEAILFNIVITGIVNLLFTVVAIATVDRFGRRGLLLIGSIGLALIYAALGLCYFLESHGMHVLILIVSAIACYAMSLAPVVWVVIAEIFPIRTRGIATSIAVFSLWLACIVLTLTFPSLNRVLGPHGTFWLYGLICVIGAIGIYRKLPETKGKSLEEIEGLF